MKQKNKPLLWVVVWSVLFHVILIALTFLEVFFYSTFINSGHDIQFYEQHAEESGPFVGIIAGFALVYWVAKSLVKKNPDSQKLVGLGLPLGYILVDILLLVLSGAIFMVSHWTFPVSYLTKSVAGYLAVKASKV